MTLPRPTPEQERWLELGHRFPDLRTAADARAGGWKRSTLPSRALMSVLGLVAASMITGSLMLLPGRLLVAGLVMILAAEWLVRQRRLVGGGVEEALLLCGALAIVAQLLLWVEPGDDALIILVGSAAVLAVGLRLGNAAFTTLAALGVSVAVACAGKASLLGSGLHALPALAGCVLVALLALGLGARRWRRPSHDRMLDGLVMALPVAGYGWALVQGGPGPPVPALLALGFAVLLASTGLRRRAHAPIWAALLMLAALAHALRQPSALPLHGWLIVCGSLALGLGIAVERALRRPRAGVTSAPVGPRSRLTDLLQLYGAAQITPAPSAAPADFHGQDGSFGGGGASGRF